MSTHIICAVRGGPESTATVKRAIDLALMNNARLIFFHASDIEFLGDAAIGSPVSVMHKELREMSEFAMLILCERARRRGVKEVDFVIREGSVRAQLIAAALETHSKIMVMGRPTRSPGSDVFKTAEMGDFVKALEEVGELEVIWVLPENSDD